MDHAGNGGSDADIKSSFRASIKLNPAFGPSYDRLAGFLIMRHRNLDEARMMELNAIQMEPTNLNYRMNMANIFLGMERGQDAVTVIRNGMHLAKSPADAARVASFLQSAEQYAASQKAMQEQRNFERQTQAETAAVEATGKVAPVAGIRVVQQEEPVPSGPHRFVTGALKNVRCDTPAIDMDLISAGKTLRLHSGNYFAVQYSVLNFALKGDLNPCADLEGKSAKVEFVEAAAKDRPAVVVAVEMHK